MLHCSRDRTPSCLRRHAARGPQDLFPPPPIRPSNPEGTVVSTRDMVYSALFAAIVAALGLLPPIFLPFLPVPVTAQSLGVMLAGSVLGARRGGLALLLFVLLVAAGVPLLAGGRGGFGIFLGPSGGFVVAFPIAAFAIGLMVERSWQRLTIGHVFAFNIIGGIGVLYAVGIPWWALAAQLTLLEVAAGSVGFLPGDLIKAGIAAFVAVTVRRAYPIVAAR